MTSLHNPNTEIAKVIAFNEILSPLMISVADDMGILNPKETCDVETLILAKLVENVLDITNKYVEEKSITEDYKKWIVAINASKIVAANYKSKEDGISLDDNLSDILLEEKSIKEDLKFTTDESFKNYIFESISGIIESISKFNFATDENNIISLAEKQISTYANRLFANVDRSELNKDDLRKIYISTIHKLSQLFEVCYTNVIDSLLEVPKEDRKKFIEKHVVGTSDSLEKSLDGFFSRVSIISNISIALDIPINSNITKIV